MNLRLNPVQSALLFGGALWLLFGLVLFATELAATARTMKPANVVKPATLLKTFSATTTATNQCVKLSWQNEPNCWYVIQSSTNLTDWQDETNLLPVWPTSVNLPMVTPTRFYRIGIAWTNSARPTVYWSTNL